MDTRFDATTAHLRDAATTLILERGVRAFSLNALAKAAYVSVGAVYERWGSASEALADVLGERSTAAFDDMCLRVNAGGGAVTLLLSDDAGDLALRLAVESLFAARDDPSRRPEAEATIDRLTGILRLGQTPVADNSAAYAVVVCIGLGLLRVGGCTVPAMAPTLGALLIAGSGGRDTSVANTAVLTPNRDLLTPPLGAVTADDETSDGLRASARRLLESDDERAATARSIAAESGVTTGALYRRYSSRSDLLVDVLMSELQGHRYAWMTTLIAALQSADPLSSAAHVMTEALMTAVADTPTNRMLLEITVTARTDEHVRRKLVGQVDTVAQSRVAVFEHLADAGLIQPHLDCTALAWLLQAAPIGGRLMCAAGVLPEAITLESGIRRVTERALAVD